MWATCGHDSVYLYMHGVVRSKLYTSRKKLRVLLKVLSWYIGNRRTVDDNEHRPIILCICCCTKLNAFFVFQPIYNFIGSQHLFKFSQVTKNHLEQQHWRGKWAQGVARKWGAERSTTCPLGNNSTLLREHLFAGRREHEVTCGSRANLFSSLVIRTSPRVAGEH